MMMKTIPLFIFFVILLLYFPDALNAQTPAREENPPPAPAGRKGNPVWYVGFRSGALWGRTHELVYQSTGSGDLLSRLDWELKPLVYAGAVLGIGPGESGKQSGFFAELGAAAGLPMENGNFEDRDWEYVSEPQRLTKFSRHPSATEQALLLDGRVGISLPLRYRLSFSLFLFFSWNHFSWLGRDGYGQYTQGPYDSPGRYPTRPWGSDIPKDYDSFRGKDVIRYTQDWFIPGLGGGFNFPLVERLDGGVSLLVSPLAFAVDTDEHLLRKIVFRNYLKGGFFFEGSCFLAFSVSPRARLLIRTAYRVITGLRGDTYMWQPGDVLTGVIYDSAGADISYGSVELAFEWFFR
jgi:outer membrane protease